MFEHLRALFTARFGKTERGASAVEYGLLVAGIAAVIVVAVMALGPMVSEAFKDTCDEMAKADSISTTCTDDGA